MRRIGCQITAPLIVTAATSALSYGAACVGSTTGSTRGTPAAQLTTINTSMRFQSTRSAPNYALLPPSFDLPRWDDDASKGYCLRVSYTEERVVFTYIKQAPGTTAKDSPQASTDPNVSTEGAVDGPKRRHGERMVSVYLPNVYIARFLAVLEGTLPKCEIASRQTNGTFSAGAEPHTYVLSCTSTIPNKEPLQWTTHLDPAAGLMLHRFLTQSLHYNNGFQK